MAAGLYVESSALLRSLLEPELTPEIVDRITKADHVVTSRLSIVEAARAILRARRLEKIPEERLADVERLLDSFFARCEISELTAEVCELASRVAPRRNLRTLDSLHLATFLLARKRVENLGLLTADRRLAEAAETT